MNREELNQFLIFLEKLEWIQHTMLDGEEAFMITKKGKKVRDFLNFLSSKE